MKWFDEMVAEYGMEKAAKEAQREAVEKAAREEVTTASSVMKKRKAGRKATVVRLNPEAEQIIAGLNTSPYNFRKFIYPFIKAAIAGAAKRQSLSVTMQSIRKNSMDYDKDTTKAQTYGVVPRTKTIIRAFKALSMDGTVTVQSLRDAIGISKETALQVVRILDDVQERIADSLAFNVRFIRGRNVGGGICSAPLVNLGFPKEELPY